MCNMQELNLDYNKIGDVGLQAFADALGKGALAPGAYISLAEGLGGNSATETGKQAMRDAAKARGLSVYV